MHLALIGGTCDTTRKSSDDSLLFVVHRRRVPVWIFSPAYMHIHSPPAMEVAMDGTSPDVAVHASLSSADRGSRHPVYVGCFHLLDHAHVAIGGCGVGVLSAFSGAQRQSFLLVTPSSAGGACPRPAKLRYSATLPALSCLVCPHLLNKKTSRCTRVDSRSSQLAGCAFGGRAPSPPAVSKAWRCASGLRGS